MVHPEDRERIMREVLLQGRNQIPELHTELGTYAMYTVHSFEADHETKNRGKFSQFKGKEKTISQN